MSYVLPALAALTIWLFCLFDVLITDEEVIRHLPKFGWFLVVLFTVLLGALAWLLLGRPRLRPVRIPRALAQPAPGVYRGPDDDPEFLASLDRRLRGD